MVIDYELFEELGLLVQKFSGKFSVETYAKYMSTLMPTLQPQLVKKVLIDIRKIDFGQDYDNLAQGVEKMTAFRKQMLARQGNPTHTVHAFWVNDPNSTVIAQLFTYNFPQLEYHYCTTFASIKHVLNLPEQMNVLENKMHSLSNRFEDV